jgi:ParB family chromosome partitioning protein
MAGNHDDRRRLARAALAEGWNVRRTEAEARAASEAAPDDGPVRARRGAMHPDQEAAASRLGEAFGRALGADVRVTPRGTGYKVALTFESLDEALELASRIGTAEPV